MQTRYKIKYIFSIIMLIIMASGSIPQSVFADETKEEIIEEQIENMADHSVLMDLPDVQENTEQSPSVGNESSGSEVFSAILENDADNLASGTCGALGNEENVTWVLTEDGMLRISGSGMMMDYQMSGSDVPWSSNRSQIKNLVIEEGVTSIGNYAFLNCQALERASISYVSIIGIQAFQNCSTLQTVEVGNVTSMGQRAFANCRNLTNADLSLVEDIGKNAFQNTGLSTVNLSGSVNIGDNAFQGLTNLTSVILGNNLKTIGPAAFSNTGITQITVPGSVEIFGNNAFALCQLTTAVIEEGITEIPLQGFAFNATLECVSLPSTLTKVDTGAFRDCTVLSSVSYPGTAEQWEAIQIEEYNEPLTLAKMKTDGKYSYVTNVTLNKEDVTLPVYHTEMLTAQSEPEDASNPVLTWSSSD